MKEREMIFKDFRKRGYLNPSAESKQFGSILIHLLCFRGKKITLVLTVDCHIINITKALFTFNMSNCML